MSTLVVYADTSDGVVNSGSEQPDYATAQLGTYYLTAYSTETMLQGGQAAGNTGDPDYIDTYVILLIYESFDTSSIGAGNTVSAATLNLRLSSAGRASWAVRARMHDWGTSLTTADWVDTQTITGKTLVAHLDVPTNITDVSSDFTNDAFPANINRTGSTRIVLSDTWIDAGQAPTGNETWSIRSADDAGTTRDPKLTVTYAAGRTPDGPGPTMDAVILCPSGTKTLTAAAIIKGSGGGSFTGNAAIKRNQPGSFAADAVLSVGRSGSLTAAAVIAKPQAGSFAANAVIAKTITGSLTSDAIRLRTFYFGSGPDPR